MILTGLKSYFELWFIDNSTGISHFIALSMKNSKIVRSRVKITMLIEKKFSRKKVGEAGAIGHVIGH